MIKYLQNKYDWWIYHRAFKPLNRIIKSNAGFGYLFYLFIQGYLKDNPISDDLKHATEQFYNEIKNLC